MAELERLTGTVKWYKAEKNYGFIVPDNGSPDVFLHRSAIIKAGLFFLRKGDRVRFRCKSSRSGSCPAAMDIELVSSGKDRRVSGGTSGVQGIDSGGKSMARLKPNNGGKGRSQVNSDYSGSSSGGGGKFSGGGGARCASGEVRISGAGLPQKSKPIVSVKEWREIKRIEEVEDCFISDFDPFEPVSNDKDFDGGSSSGWSGVDDELSSGSCSVGGGDRVSSVCSDYNSGSIDGKGSGKGGNGGDVKVSGASGGGGGKSQSVCSDGGHVNPDEEIKSIVRVKDWRDIKKIEEVEDCFILDFDPFEPVSFEKLSLGNESQLDDDREIFTVAEKGQSNGGSGGDARCGCGAVRISGVGLQWKIKEIVSAKDWREIERIEEVEDCFILDFDPFQPVSNGVDDKGSCSCGGGDRGRRVCSDLKGGSGGGKGLSKGGSGGDDEVSKASGGSGSSIGDGKGRSVCSGGGRVNLDEEIRYIFCVKEEKDIKKIEEVEDCFILDFDPFEPVSFEKLSLGNESHLVDDNEISIVAEKGQVACRDYPHPRHLCAKYPFEETPHSTYCKMCFCYVCDIAAPCKQWDSHKDATGDLVLWKSYRELRKSFIKDSVEKRAYELSCTSTF